jgi:hypothetical protein
MDLLARARELYLGGRMHDAFEAAQKACELHSKDPSAWLLLARIARRIRMPAVSDDAFRRASQLTGARPPYRVDRRHFEQLASEASSGSHQLTVAALPDEDEVRQGVPPDAPSRQANERTILYQENIENEAGDEAELKAAIVRALGRG